MVGPFDDDETSVPPPARPQRDDRPRPTPAPRPSRAGPAAGSPFGPGRGPRPASPSPSPRAGQQPRPSARSAPTFETTDTEMQSGRRAGGAPNPWDVPEESLRTMVAPGIATAAPHPGRAAEGEVFEIPVIAFSTSGGLGNPIIDAGRLILVLVATLRTRRRALSVTGLYDRLCGEVRRFQRTLADANVPRDVAEQASYALCSLVDETVLGTPWGAGSDWAKRGVLVQYHRDAQGGQRFFDLLMDAEREPGRLKDLLEFFYVCLSFGFQGRYRAIPNGSAQLQEVRDQLLRIVRQQRRDESRDLSLRWQGVEDRRNALVRYVPLWVVASLTLLLLTSAFIFFRTSLGYTAGELAASLNAVGRESVALRGAPPPPPPPVVPQDLPRLKQFLVTEEQEGWVTVEEYPDRSVARLVDSAGGASFRSGSTSLEPAWGPRLARVAAAINQVRGPVEVVGHTDSVPVRSLAVGSNMQLSIERARSVKGALVAAGVAEARMSADGRAETEPLRSPEVTPEDRAANRRVEIVVLEGVGSLNRGGAAMAGGQP